jgi:pimeloyl-ACP methyl ester carboxylesterase
MSSLFLKNGDGTIAYEVSGSTNGPLVVCAPSMGDLRQEYRFLAPLLSAAGCRVALMDVRGHGESSTGWADYSVAGVGSDILALIRQLGGPAYLVGTSMSAGAAVWAAAEQPASLRGIVLVGPFVRGGNNWMGHLLALMFSRPWGPAAWLRYYATLYPSRKPEDFGEYTRALRANLGERGRTEALQAMLRASKDASEERLARVTTPSLVLMGSRDPDFKDPAAEAAWVAQSLHAKHTLMAGAGHYPQAEFPAETAGLILPFFKSIERLHAA